MSVGQFALPLIMKSGKSGLLTQLNDAIFKDNNWMLYLKGLQNTMLMTVLALGIGVFVGVVISMVKYTNQSTGRFALGAKLCDFYTTVVRGTPVMVQLMIIYHILFADIRWVPTVTIAGVAFGLNSGAYVAEIIRGGIQGVDKGQAETGRSLGLSHHQTMKLIVLPQAIRSILPALFNEVISLVKETAVASTVGIMDIAFAGDMVRGKSYTSAALIVVAGVYLVIVLALTWVQKIIERRMTQSA